MWTTRYLDWVKQYHAMQNQWRFEKGWQKFVGREMNHLFGKGVGECISEAFDLVSRLLSQELIWKDTPYNHDVATWRGMLTRWHHLRDIYINLANYPGTLMKYRNKDGGLRQFSASYPLFYRVKRRSFSAFIQEAPQIITDYDHYLHLIEECEKRLCQADRLVIRNDYFYKKEIRFYIHACGQPVFEMASLDGQGILPTGNSVKERYRNCR